MHQPAAFIQSDQSELRALAAEYPLATLIVPGQQGLVINHIPLLWSAQELHGHIARANELAAILEKNAHNANGEPKGMPATAIFHGPNGYVSPADYPTKALNGKVVPTWNYAVAHVSGTLRLHDETQFVRRQIDDLTAHHETPLNPKHPWTLEDAPETFAAALQKNIVGIALTIEAVTGKYKLSQNRSQDDRNGATRGVEDRGDLSLAQKMKQAMTKRSRQKTSGG